MIAVTCFSQATGMNDFKHSCGLDGNNSDWRFHFLVMKEDIFLPVMTLACMLYRWNCGDSLFLIKVVLNKLFMLKYIRVSGSLLNNLLNYL